MGPVNFPGFEKLRNVSAPASLTGQMNACCPAHKNGQERSPSLRIRFAGDRWLLYCHAGCSLEEICAAIGIKPRDLYLEDSDYKVRKKMLNPNDIEIAKEAVFIFENQVGQTTQAQFDEYIDLKLKVARSSE